MLGQSTHAGDTQERLSARFWERPLPAKIGGITFLIGAALLLLGGAYREHALALIGLFYAVTT